MRFWNILILLPLISLYLLVSAVIGGEHQGTVRAGYIFVDVEGNHGVHQPSYNLHDGGAVSLERFRYQWDNGMQLFANIINPTLNNRHLSLAFSKTGVVGASIAHNSYRRTYDFERTDFTRRRATSGSVWYRPVKQLKLFGGYGVTDKQGNAIKLGASEISSELQTVDYVNRYYHAGLELKHQRSFCRFEYRMSDFSDELNSNSDRDSRRMKLTAYSPLPLYDAIVLSGGFQHFEHKIDYRFDTLSANTVWGAVRYNHKRGYHLSFSFMFDRARRTGDLAATDNIIRTVTVGRTWRNQGGITATYGDKTNDDVRVERSGSNYSLSGWLIPVKELTLRAGLGFSCDNIDSGRTLTGDRDYARSWLLVRYRLPDGFIRIRIDDRHRDNDDIGSSVDFTRFSGDVSYALPEYGELGASYSLSDGNYTNTSGVFDFSEHVLAGDAMSREYRKVQIGVGGSYYRARQDVDVEAFTVRITGRYRLVENARLEVIYATHNFDNLADLSESYTEYYTANVVEASILFEL